MTPSVNVEMKPEDLLAGEDPQMQKALGCVARRIGTHCPAASLRRKETYMANCPVCGQLPTECWHGGVR